MTTAVDIELEATTEVAPTKPPKLNSAAFKEVPQQRAVRDAVRAAVEKYCKTIDKSKPLTKESTRVMAAEVLKSLGLGEQYLGFTMVMLTNEFWREQVAAIPFNRRLLLLPHCLKNAEGCPADYDEFGLDCKKCGACYVADFKTKAEELGYKVLVCEGTPIVLKIIVCGHVDAIVGVACLNVLEKAIDKILLAGIPCVATPLLSSNCKNTSVDDDWVFELIDLHTPPAGTKTKTYVHLMRAANAMFEEPELTRLVPPPRAASPGNRPATQARDHRLRLARPGRQAFAAVHHAGRLRRPQGRTGHARGHRLGTARRGQARRARHRDVPQGVARPRRHRGRRHLPLRPGNAAPRPRRRHGDQRRRLPDRPRLSPRSARPQGTRAPTSRPTSSTSSPTRT